MYFRLTHIAAASLAAISMSSHASAFTLQEATVDSIHSAFQSGETTCAKLVKGYLARIEAYDQQGPALKAVLTINPKALEQAREMDAAYSKDPTSVGTLHCIPVLLKDNFDTFDMPTSSGNVAMKDSQPTDDAFTVARMREAGALILGKTNLQEFARGGVSISSLGGQTLNPYDLTRTPGGSSGGTGAALASGFAVLGTGSDTGQSIRSPASANSLVGVRPTRGLISRDGVIPNSFTQDEIGPITRTVKDAAYMLDVMVGFDAADPITALGAGKAPDSYVDSLRPDALKGARIALFTDLLGSDERHAEVNRVMRETVQAMEKAGATIVELSMPELKDLTKVLATDALEAREAFASYFGTLPDDAPIRSFEQLVSTRSAEPNIQATLEKELSIDKGMQSDDYKTRTLNREKLRIALA
nr:amidase [Pseudomonas sp.]